jgi:cell wall-associated NlpC family hydrolase
LSQQRAKLAHVYAAIIRHALAIALGLAGCAATTPALPSPSHEAVRMVGTPYRWGGRHPDVGFDCSGLVAHAFERAWGIELPRSAREQSKAGRPVRLADLRPGDLVFYNTRRRPYSHVGIYLGEGRFVHAPRPGARVRIESMKTSYWRTRFNGARRIDNDSH